MMKTNLFLLIVLLSFFCSRVLAQELTLRDVAESESTPRWIVFKDAYQERSDNFFEIYSSLLGLSNNDEMILVRTFSERETHHYKVYQQYYQGIRIEHATIVLHESEGKVKIANGDYLKNVTIEMTPSVSIENAQNIALAYLGMDSATIEGFSVPVDVPMMPRKTEILLTSIDYNLPFEEKNFRLIYRVPILISDISYIDIDIDAATGGVLRTSNGRTGACNPGTVTTPYNGVQTVYTANAWEPFWNHFRLDECGTSSNGYIRPISNIII